MHRPIRTVAIVGGGPAGASLGAYLARAGLRVALFDVGGRPELIVGESLVPAAVAFLRKLGIEEEVASYGTLKPGATFTMPGNVEQMHFRFDEVPAAQITYAYNVPRARLDASIRDAALRAGAGLFAVRARVERAATGVRLADETLRQTDGFLTEQPDLVVDASGRSRLLVRLLDLPTEVGPRRDTALHAHMEGIELAHAGHVHSSILDRGWCWRIPLPGRVSVGLVVPSDVLATFGETLEQQFDAYLQSDPVAHGFSAHAKRITPVVKYTNYQLRATAGVGSNWALVGDAFGFIDPVFSSGLLVGLDSAFELSRAVLDGTPRAFERYERHVLRHLANWHSAVEKFYDGRLFTLFRVGNIMRETFFGRLMEPHFLKHMPRVFTGEATSRRYSIGLLNFMCNYGLARRDPSELAVR